MIYVFRVVLYLIAAGSACSVFAHMKMESTELATMPSICFTVAIAALGVIEAITAVRQGSSVAVRKEVSQARPSGRGSLPREVA